MRLERLDLTRYGIFTDKSLTFTPPVPGETDLHLVYGPNEAGKSTLFSAWLDLLFGIPLRSRYDFLHPGPTMQIGATLSRNGEVIEVKRIKRKTSSLLDRHDAPIPDASLRALLGNLTREGYSAMFSLDEETLEQGGEGILASDGDLGEMLFSASAGLSGLTPGLETIRKDLDAFHRPRARSGWLRDARNELATLDAQRKEIEVSATALKALSRDAEAAEQEWREARAFEDRTRAEVERLTDLASALPLIAQRAALLAALTPLDHLPDADATLVGEFARIDGESQALTAQIRERVLRLARLDEKRKALPDDPAALANAEMIAAAEALRTEHDAAIKDLPRRMDEAQDSRSRIAGLLSELGCADAEPGAVALPVAAISAMRGLLAERSGVIQLALAAAAEARKAQDVLAREREQSGDLGPPEDEATLVALLTRLRAQDPVQARRQALVDRDRAQDRLDAAIVTLAPWTGDAETLAALAVPPGWQVEAWQQDRETARQQEQDARRDIEALRGDLDRLTSDALGRAQAQMATGVTMADAGAARSRREASWSAHLRTLDAASAAQFEQSLREDDRISALLAEAMAEARREAVQKSERGRLQDRLAAAKARQQSAMQAQAALTAAIEAACGALGLSGAGLADLKGWLDLRLVALQERGALREADSSLRRSDEVLAQSADSLAAALGPQAGGGAPDYESLLAIATARLDAAERRRDIGQRLQKQETELRERQAAQRDAEAALQDWRASWAKASQGSILAAHPDDAPGLATMLDQLDELGSELRALSALDDRIAKMRANRDSFQAARSSVASRLGVADDTPWAEVLSRLRRGEDAARDREGLDADIADETELRAEDDRKLAVLQQQASDLGASLNWPTDQGPLADHVAQCQRATDLRQQIAGLDDTLRDRPAPDDGDDPAAVRARIDELTTDHQAQRTETEARHAACLTAKAELDAIGGDDALARIASARANLLEEMRDRVQNHLARRFGLIAFETGLRRYREQHRSAMLGRASDAFRVLSRSAYSGLSAQPDSAREVLVAQSAAGGAKFATDLSKGTRFQLYLALRIAGYHELAQSRPSVPFIADDIMETFDDDRSAAAFRLLSDMSRVGQVIYLTHHRHLCDIARTACPDVKITELAQA